MKVLKIFVKIGNFTDFEVIFLDFLAILTNFFFTDFFLTFLTCDNPANRSSKPAYFILGGRNCRRDVLETKPTSGPSTILSSECDTVWSYRIIFIGFSLILNPSLKIACKQRERNEASSHWKPTRKMKNMHRPTPCISIKQSSTVLPVALT